MKDKVSVLLSTYNGEEYVEMQINSILQQKGVVVHLFIRDDGSHDDTPKILRKYSDNAAVSIIYGNNIGYAESFQELSKIALTRCDDAYFAFSDQDDYWKEDKLSSAVELLDRNDNQFQVYFSSLEFVDKDLQTFGYKSYSSYQKTFGSSLSRSSVAGCTMVMNRGIMSKTVERAAPLPNGIGHDAWAYKVCLMYNGYVAYDDDAKILFRRHSHNTSDGGGKISQKLIILQKLLTTEKDAEYKTSTLLLETYHDIPTSSQTLLMKVVHYRDSLKNRLGLAFDSAFYTGISTIDISRFLLILLGRF